MRMTTESISRDEIETLAARLEDYASGLLPEEQAVLRLILMRAGGDRSEDVEGHGLARMSIAALVLAAAGTVGVANANAGPIHPASPAVAHVHHVVSTVGDEKGGAVTITYTTGGGSGSR
jgi:hypothetical protein